MAEQLAFDFAESDQLPFAALINNYFFIGFEPLMVAQAAIKNNRQQIKMFDQTKVAQLYLPMRSKPFSVQAPKIKLDDDGRVFVEEEYEYDREGRMKLRPRTKSVGTSLEQLGDVFGLHDGKAAYQIKTLIPSDNTISYTLDSVNIDSSNDDELAITMFVAGRYAYNQAKGMKVRTLDDAERIRKLRGFTPDLKKSKLAVKYVISLVFIFENGILKLSDDSSIQSYTVNTGQKFDFEITEHTPGTGLAFLYNYFYKERLSYFFSSSSVSPQTTKLYIDAIGDLVMKAITKFYPAVAKTTFPAGYYDGLIFKQAMNTMFFKDMFPEVEMLRPIFVNSLHATGEITPFKNQYAQATFTNILISNAGNTAIEAPHLNEYYPTSKWALKKTAEFWRTQRNFFTEDGYLTMPSLMDVIRVLRQVHKFYCIYHKHFSDQLDNVDELYSTYYLRYIVYDYDQVHFTASRQQDYRRINVQNTYAEFIISAFYNSAGLVGQYMSNAKMRRIFSEFFKPFNMFGGGNEYNTVDGHIYATLLNNYNYLGDFEQLYTNMTTHPVAKDVFVQELDWRDYTSLRQIHDSITAYMRRHKHKGVPRTNTLYDIFDNADLKIPDTNLQLIFAKHTGEIRSWGEEQGHCIATYADRLNQGEYLMFGVWDTDAKKWWGHCMMTATEALKHAKPKKFYDTPPAFWKEHQFYGAHNSGLDANKKRLVIEHMLSILYPKKPEATEAPEPEKEDMAVVTDTAFAVSH